MTTPGAENQPDNVPEADWVEQEVDADPLTDDAGEDSEAGVRRVDLARGTDEVNEADLAEQATGVYGEVDEYRG